MSDTDTLTPDQIEELLREGEGSSPLIAPRTPPHRTIPVSSTIVVTEAARRFQVKAGEAAYTSVGLYATGTWEGDEDTVLEILFPYESIAWIEFNKEELESAIAKAQEEDDEGSSD